MRLASLGAPLGAPLAATDISKKLFRKLQECEGEVERAHDALKASTEAYHLQIPNFSRDLGVMSSSRRQREFEIILKIVSEFIEGKVSERSERAMRKARISR